jgi:hypothetical protein
VKNLEPLEFNSGMLLASQVLSVMQTTAIARFFGQNLHFGAKMRNFYMFKQVELEAKKIRSSDDPTPVELDFVKCCEDMLKFFNWSAVPAKEIAVLTMARMKIAHP